MMVLYTVRRKQHCVLVLAGGKMYLSNLILCFCIALANSRCIAAELVGEVVHGYPGNLLFSSLKLKQPCIAVRGDFSS